MKNIGYQLYSSRNFGPLAETLSALADLGYSEVEGYGALFASPEALKGLGSDMRAVGLTMPTGHFGLDMVEKEPGRVIDIAGELGISAVFVPYLDAAQRPADAAGWQAFGRRLEAAGAPLAEAGLAFGWHNHDFEFAGSAERPPLHDILDAAPALAFEFDVAWCVRAGADPLKVIDRYGDRIVAAHVKDIAPAGTCLDEDGWADVGQGTMDWRKLVAALRATACRHLVMEHDNPSDDMRFARRSIDFMNDA